MNRERCSTMFKDLDFAYQLDLFNTDDYPPEHSFSLTGEHDPVALLLREKAQLERSRLAPPGAWVETGSVGNRKDFYQAIWRSDRPIFLGKRNTRVKHLYIGKAGSAEHRAALRAVQNRKRLRSVIAQLQILGVEV